MQRMQGTFYPQQLSRLLCFLDIIFNFAMYRWELGIPAQEQVL